MRGLRGTESVSLADVAAVTLPPGGWPHQGGRGFLFWVSVLPRCLVFDYKT